MDKRAILEWHAEMGVDETVGEAPVDQLAASKAKAASPERETTTDSKPKPVPASNPLHHSPSSAAATARVLADQCHTLAELEAAVRGFDGCALKKTASKTVFCDGNPTAKVMVIGEAPGAQEDIQGIPFCGPSGQLLDKVFASIGLTRADSLYISNTVFWRPPGNRQPSPEETAICLPFVEKHIALINPKLLVLSGGTATNTLMQKDQSISRLRGRLYEYSNVYLQKPVQTVLTYHPSYLMRSPSQKRLAWQDMLMIKSHLEKL
jgi:uracil-DNA glycosylase